MYTIYGVLMNAQDKIMSKNRIIQLEADAQLTAAIELLHKGYGVMDNYHEIIGKYGSAEAAPRKGEA